AALLVWRLSRGPLDLAVLTPYLERALSRADGSLVVRIARTELAWDAREHHVDLRARDARLLGAGGEVFARLPTIALELSASALIRGSVTPSAIELLAPRLRLVRVPGGRLGLGIGEGGDSAAGM